MLIVFAAIAAYELFVIVSDLLEIDLANDIETGDFTDARITSNDNRQRLAGIGELLLVVPAAVVWIRWFHRASQDARAVGYPGRFGDGWAIGGWFVPFLALWRPKQIANDLWAAIGRDPGALLALWWTCWISMGIGTRVIAGIDVKSPADLRSQDVVDIVLSVIWIAGALLACRIALTITEGLESRQQASPPPDS